MPPRKSVPKISPKKKLLINYDHSEECRAVILDEGKLEAIIIEHSSRELIKGNIYLGVITRVEPAIEAAFIDFGGKKFGFLPFKDVLKESYLQTREKKAKVRIQDVLVRGQKILVQVVKESRDAKGPSMTNGITIPGRFLVLMSGSPSTGVSRKIEDESERRKLKEILADLELPENMGVIIRTAGLGRTKAELQKDLQMLLKIWESVQEKLKDTTATAPVLLYEGPDMVVRTVRDHFTADTSEIIIDNVKSYKALKEFMKLTMPRMGSRIKLYRETRPLFSAHNVEEQIENIYMRTVQLPSGGSIVFDMGEAMVSVDVNSGKTTSASQLEETAFQTNMEAADEIARQLRLRDLGGLVVIDFIDMFQKKNKALIEKQMKQACKNDKARINISRISRFGLLEMSRQRMSPPLKEGVFDTCPHCVGSGTIRSDSNQALKVIRSIQETLAEGSVKIMLATVSSSVANYLLNNKMEYLVGLQDTHGFQLQFNSKEHLDQKEFLCEILERKKEEEKPREPEKDRRRGRAVTSKKEDVVEAKMEEPANSRRRGRPVAKKEDGAEPEGEERPERPSRGRRGPSKRGGRSGSRGRQTSAARKTAAEGAIVPTEESPQMPEGLQGAEGPLPEAAPKSEERPKRTRRRPAGTGTGDTQKRKPSVRKSTSTRRTSPQRGRRWRSQRAETGGEKTEGESPESPNESPMNQTDIPGNIGGPSLPLAGEMGRLEGQPEGNTGFVETSKPEPPAPPVVTPPKLPSIPDDSAPPVEKTNPGI